jgi:transcriptional regulator with XRE-family HTH domain
MTRIVHQMHIRRQAICACRAVYTITAFVHDAYMQRKPFKPQPKPIYGPHFLKQWRRSREKTIEQAAEFVGMSHSQLSRIERRLQKFDQELLEKLAELYETDVASLIMRDPSKPDGMWSLWDQAKEGEKAETRRFLEYQVKSRTGT